MPAVTGNTAVASNTEWDAGLQAIELALGQIDVAFEQGDPQQVAVSAQALHEALSQAIHIAHQAKQSGLALVLPGDVTQRLTLARARVRAHQQAVVRGRVAAERTLSVLIEAPADATYQSLGGLYGANKVAYR
ncbi:MAG: hypothetical protein RI907_3785 [Pseudomonadota bacterium]|jgi:hypothetical protein